MKNLASQLASVQTYVLRESSSAVAGVAGSRALSRGKRLGIYRDAYFLRLHELLSSSYGALKVILGDERFDELVAAYTAQHRSHHYSIRYYGDTLAKFLAGDARFKSEPALAEVAAWEWAMAHAFDAADAEPVDVAALSRVPPHLWAEVSFRFHPSVKPMAARWNCVALWQAANRGEPLPDQIRRARASTWVVWRRGLDVLFERLDMPERDALRLALKCRSFPEICASAPSALDDAGQAGWAVQLIQRWVARGWIIELVTP
jgi:hypothetical protein